MSLFYWPNLYFWSHFGICRDSKMLSYWKSNARLLCFIIATHGISNYVNIYHSSRLVKEQQYKGYKAYCIKLWSQKSFDPKTIFIFLFGYCISWRLEDVAASVAAGGALNLGTLSNITEIRKCGSKRSSNHLMTLGALNYQEGTLGIITLM